MPTPLKRTYTESEALSRAAALCSAGEQCVSQIEEKLARWGQPAEAQTRIIEHLIEEKYIDESRFARAYALDKLRYSGWGRVKIGMCLRHLGIAEADRRRALADLPADEYRDTLDRLLSAKARSVKAATPYERRGKLIRFALGRGFVMEEITGSPSLNPSKGRGLSPDSDDEQG